MLTYNEIPAGITEILQRMETMETNLERFINGHKPSPPDSYITRLEAANILHITLPTLLKWTMEEKIKGYRIGRRVLYKKNEIEGAVTAIFTHKKTR